MTEDKLGLPLEKMEAVDRRAFLQVAVGAAAGSALAGGLPGIAAAQPPKAPRSGGHLYMQTNETRNAVVHYRRAANGALAEVERISTGRSGSGGFNPISGLESAPNAFENAGSVILTPDHRLLFVTNGGDNSVTSFAVGENGRLKLLDIKSTGNPVTGKSGTAKSLAYAPSSGTLFVLHSFGPEHLRTMSVDAEGKLTLQPKGYTVTPSDKPKRVPTMVVVSPDKKFVLVGSTFDEPVPGAYPDGLPILWVQGFDGKLKSIYSNYPDPDGLATFPLEKDGTLGTIRFHDAKAGSPFYIAFLNGRRDTFVIGYAVGDGCAIGTIDQTGSINVGPLVKINTSDGLPSELCWLSIAPDDRTVYATNFGYGDITSFHVNCDGTQLAVAKDPACPKVPGDGTFRSLNTTVTSGPNDIWITPDGAHLYQIYPNASKLVGYATQPDGSLKEVASIKVPYNSPMGLVGI